MKTITKVYNLYNYSELPTNIQDEIIDEYWDLNVDYQWWDFTYDDAKEIGLKITGFDLDRAYYVKGELIISVQEVCSNIIRDHGQTCDTYKLAQSCLEEYSPILSDYMNEESENYESSDLENIMQDLEQQFTEDLCKEYLSILISEYEYLTSKPAIIETIESNEYLFTQDGKLE